MRIFLKILTWAAISLCALIFFAFVAFAIYDGTFYRKELRKIQKQLNAMDGVTVLNMRGHRDISLECRTRRSYLKKLSSVVVLPKRQQRQP